MTKLYWITGLAGAGKTTLAQAFYKHLKPSTPNLVYLDGDRLRKVFSAQGQYETQQRLQLAMQYARLCRLLIRQDIHVICATISMFDKVRNWNRKQISGYIEIFIDVPKSTLHVRNQKQLYSQFKQGQINNIVGEDIIAERPKAPDITLFNDHQTQLNDLLQNLLHHLQVMHE